MKGAAAACTFVIYLPSPTKNWDFKLPLTSTLPVIRVPLWKSKPEPVAPVVTINVSPLATDAVADPLAINGDAAACTFVINLPSPTKNPSLDNVRLPLTEILPLNWEPLSCDWTLNPKLGLTEAVTEPDLISVETNASSVNAERGMFLK